MKTVKTAAQILTMFDTETQSVTVTSVSKRFELNPSAASRLLASLATSGIIQQEADRSYRAGPLAYRLGLLYHAHNRLADRISDGARKVVAETGRTCWISVLSDTDSMLISRFPGPNDQGFHVHPGNRVPANASASGKALLSRMADADIHQLLSSKKLSAWTERSKTDPASILADIRLIREFGWSINLQELFSDTVSVSTAFSSPLEATAMAISVSIHSSNLKDVVQGIEALLEASTEIGNAIGDDFWIGDKRRLDVDVIAEAVNSYANALGVELKS